MKSSVKRTQKRYHFESWIGFVIMMLVFLLMWCGSSKTLAEEAQSPLFKEVAQIAQNSCVKSMCHRWSSYEDIKALVTSGNVEDSKIYKMIKNDRMPKMGDKLTDTQKKMIYDWIKANTPR